MVWGLAGILLSTRFAPLQTYDLLWRPKAKETHVYGLDVAFEFSDGSLVNVKGSSRFRVVSVHRDGGYILESSSFGMSTVANGEAQVVPDEPATSEEFNRWGGPVGGQNPEDAQDPFATLMDRLSRFQAPLGPVKVGDTWTNLPLKIPSGHGIPPRITYSLVSIDKFQDKAVEKVTYVASDQPGESTATGTILLDFTTHCLTQLIVNIPRFRPDADGPSAVVTVRLTEKNPS